MTFVNYTQYGPCILKQIRTNFGRKQSCDIEGCCQKSRAQFEIYSQSFGFTRYACSYCTSYLTGLDISRLLVVETYIENIKNQFKSLKNLVGMNVVYNHPNQDLVSKLDTTIGEHKVIITKFKDGKYNLIIDGKPIKADLYKTFKSKKQVTQCAIDLINNRNKDKFYYYITS